MTIFRFDARAAIGMLLLSGCEAETRTVREIIASNLSDDALLAGFGDRLNTLAKDKDAFVAEMREAGFVPRSLQSNCTSWDYPVKKPEAAKPDTALRAFAVACGDGTSMEVERVGIAHHPLSYD